MQHIVACMLVTFVAFLGLSDGATFILTAPAELHYDAEFLVTVTASGIEEPESVYLEYTSRNFKFEGPLNSKTLNFTQDAVQTWGVKFPWKRMQELDETMLELTMTEKKLENQKTEVLTFSKRSGYIFIQTDKPLYTPRQIVKFRVVAVDEQQRLAQYPLKVDVLNDKQIVVDRMRYTAEEAFKAQEFVLPREASSGTWSITAAFEGQDNSYSAKQTVQFEVKEYVLPQFYSKISISEDVITKSTEWIVVELDSRYVYGRPVIGNAEMRLGVWEPSVGVTDIDYHIFEELRDGKLKKDIRISKLLPRGKDFYRTRRLYVSVNITESGTLENDTIIDTSTFIAHPYYELNYNKSKSTFKPGYPYLFRMQATTKSSRPSSWIKTYTTAYYCIKRGAGLRKIYLDSKLTPLDGNGEMDWRLTKIPENAQELVIKTIILDLKQAYTVYEHKVLKAESKSNQYLHITMEKEVQGDSDGRVLLLYTPPSGDLLHLPPDKITVMVLAKGQVLFSSSTVRNVDGKSTIDVPLKFYWDLTPTMRVVAFFHSKGEMIMDSLVVDTKDTCVEELELHSGRGIMRSSSVMIEPKEEFTLEVHGGPYMKVGLVAVDKAVYLLNDKITLTRDSMFRQLGSHDSGSISGDGKDVQEILKNSGLIHMMITSDETEVDFTQLLRPLVVNKDTKTAPSGPNLFDYSHRVNVPTDTGPGQGPTLAEAPPHTVRKYFPESWLFEEFSLPGNGLLNVNMTMPDSLTTWSYMAVGVSSMRGVCVSEPREVKVEKLFFVDVRMPYKVTRLEVVKVRIAVYNFREDRVELYGQVSGTGVCFPTEKIENFNDNGTHFTLAVDRRSTKGLELKMIPLRNGELTIKVDVAVRNDPTRDVVEKKLYVEAEGLRVKKSITFVLDPEAKHATFRKVKQNRIVLSKTATISNSVDTKNKKQRTKIDLALPADVIQGTERCHIAAFGDLMGDIINHAVIQSRSLIDQPVLDAEEVLGDLGPTVHAIHYAKENSLLDDKLAKKGGRFVKHAVARLLNYRTNQAFSLKADSKPATWLTAFVLKTLCHATSLTFIDKKAVIDDGFEWLLAAINDNGTLNENDWRLANESLEYKLMLSADVLIALKECYEAEKQNDTQTELEASVAFFLEDHLHCITQPMILAKAAYALHLFDKDAKKTKVAVNTLLAKRRKSNLDHYYWASEAEGTEAKNVPFWYRRGAKAASIEGTAFALLLFLERPGTNVDAIADWLVAQRNENGAFVGAMDSTAAIQALAKYSRQKHVIEVDLRCNVSSFQLKEYKHSFKFTEENAVRVKAVNNVPVGQVLEVITRGRGLGQMQVNVEYNVPIDKNKHCPFRVEVELEPTKATMSNLNKGPLCLSCGIGCPEEEGDYRMGVRQHSTSNFYEIDRSAVRIKESANQKQRHKVGMRKQRKRSKGTDVSKRRKTREAIFDIRQHPAASKKVMCFHICLQHLDNFPSGPTTLDIEMLSGYNPVESDWKQIDNDPSVKRVEYLEDRAMLRVHFYHIENSTKTCLGFRARDDMEVGRPAPATVIIRQEGIPYPVCALDYKPPQDTASLQVFCADISNNNRGECRCYSGLCSSCRPYRTERQSIGLNELRKMNCESDIVYQLQMTKWEDQNQWFEIDAHVLSINKTAGSHSLNPGDTIKLHTPSSCYCPVGEYMHNNGTFYMLSPDVERLIDHKGNLQYRYLIDQRSRILRVSIPGDSSSSNNSEIPRVQHEFLKAALRGC